MSDCVRLFCGAAPNNEDLEGMSVCEVSLRKHSSLPIEITWMQLSRDPKSFWYSSPNDPNSWNTRGWATPFTGFRFAIPAFCNFQGRAIYMDGSDMIAMADIAELWTQSLDEGMAVLSKGQPSNRYCVTLFDCAAVKPCLPTLEELKRHPSRRWTARDALAKVTQSFKGNWNCLDGEDYDDIYDPDIKILHCTSIPEQPANKHAIPRLKREGSHHWYAGNVRPHRRPEIQALFDRLLLEAEAKGYGIERYRKEPFHNYRIRQYA